MLMLVGRNLQMNSLILIRSHPLGSGELREIEATRVSQKALSLFPSFNEHLEDGIAQG